MLDFAKEKYTLKNLLAHGNTVKAVMQGAQERGIKLSDAEKDKASEVAGRLLVCFDNNEVQLGVELVGTMKLPGYGNVLLSVFSQARTPEPLRKLCVTTMIELDPKQAAPLVESLLNDKEVIAIREHIANVFAGTNRPDAHAALIQALQNAPARLQSTIALGMASSPQGGERLLASHRSRQGVAASAARSSGRDPPAKRQDR